MDTFVADSHSKPLHPNMARQKMEHLKQEVADPKIPSETKQHMEREIRHLSMRLGVSSMEFPA